VELRVYKSGQGRFVRIGTAVGAGLVALVLCHYVYVLLDRHVANAFAYKVYVEYAAPALLFVALAAATAYALNHPALVDFLIATESEMKKVSWSSRAELIGSTTVVIVTVIVLADFIFVVDFLVTSLFSDGVALAFLEKGWNLLDGILALEDVLMGLYVAVHLAVVGLVIGYGALWLARPFLQTRSPLMGRVLPAAVAVALVAWYVFLGIRIPGMGLW